ncbi:hypothetical protein, partial [Arthrobacter sp. JCM 19049]|uniref:hypothetical protein n=1 Tax=Arthrobacter sp. JCM 19049 TaxID=1460643 RepID=UPI00243673A8
MFSMAWVIGVPERMSWMVVVNSSPMAPRQIREIRSSARWSIPRRDGQRQDVGDRGELGQDLARALLHLFAQ